MLYLLLHVLSYCGQILATALVRQLLCKIFASTRLREFITETTGIENEASNEFTNFSHQTINEL